MAVGLRLSPVMRLPCVPRCMRHSTGLGGSWAISIVAHAADLQSAAGARSAYHQTCASEQTPQMNAQTVSFSSSQSHSVMSPFRTTADMPGYVDRTNPDPPLACIVVPADNRLPDAVPPTAHWWQRWRGRVGPVMGPR
jgi:hypothetical protein